MLKFQIGTGIFNRPYLYNKYGLFTCALSDVCNMILSMFSNTSLITCMEHMPPEMTHPESKITYGKVVQYFMDDDQQIGTKTKIEPHFRIKWSTILDAYI